MNRNSNIASKKLTKACAFFALSLLASHPYITAGKRIDEVKAGYQAAAAVVHAQTAMQEAGKAAQGIGQGMALGVKALTEEIKDKASEAVQAITGKGSDVKEKTQDVKEEGQGIVSKVIDSVKGAGEAIAHKAHEFMSDGEDKVATKAPEGTREYLAEEQKRFVSTGTAHGFSLPDGHGNDIRLIDYKGDVILVVNIPSRSEVSVILGKLEGLYQKYADKGLAIIAVLSEDFLAPNDHPKVPTTTLSTSFPQTGLVHVIDKRGRYEACPLYKWLNNQTFLSRGAVEGDFHKFLIGRDGEFVTWFAATTSLDDKVLVQEIENTLAA